MRKDFKHPYRVVRPKDEFGWKDAGFLFGVTIGTLIFYPFTFILKVIEYLIRKGGKITVSILWFLFCFFIFFFLFSFLFN
jgi:hypothetical protein